MSPYLLFGFLVAGVLSQVISESVVERHLGKPGIVSTLKASLLGVPLPLCSCGVIPVAASLRKHGASKGATTAFLLSTPQTGADSILVTLGLMGPVFAIVRPIAAFISGVLGGVIVEATDRDHSRGNEFALPDAPDETGSGLGTKIRSALHYGFSELPASIASALLVGMIVAGLITALIPANFFERTLGTGIAAMLVMMAAGIPMYVCATASVPIAAAMMAKGVSPGAALVFLMTGPATNAATIGVLAKTLGKQCAAIYLLVVAGTALGSGLILDRIAVSSDVHAHAMGHDMMPEWFKIACAAFLCAVLVRSWWRARPKRLNATDGDHAMILTIEGMTCNHCASSVTKALKGCAGVNEVVVDLKKKTASVSGPAAKADSLRHAVEEAGFTVVAVEPN